MDSGIVEEPQDVESATKIDKKGTCRECWHKRSHFLLATIGAVIGIGNVWRFPLLAKTYGGGSFMLVYAILIVLEGIPLTYMELSIGQNTKTDILQTWRRVHPLAAGVGYASCFISVTVASYYALTLAWCFHYFFYSFQSPLPWVFCPVVGQADTNSQSGNITSVVSSDMYIECQRSSPAEFYWYRSTLNISESISSPFEWNVYLIVLLFVVWLMVLLSMRKGIQSASQVLYFTVLFPYVGLLALIARTIVLPGATEGLVHYLTPEWSSLANPQIWVDAGAQVLFSLSIGAGCLPVFSGLTMKDGNSFIDALVIVLADSFTSLVGALVVLTILSFRAAEKRLGCLSERTSVQSILSNVTTEYGMKHDNCTIERFLDENGDGIGLAFVSFTYTISFIPGAPLFSALFFLMLVSLAFDSLVAFIIPTVQAASSLFRVGYGKDIYCTALGCFSCWCMGLFITQPSGEYIFQLLSIHFQDISLLIISLIECLIFALSKDLRLKIRKRMHPRWLSYALELLCISLSPLLLIAMVTSHYINNGIIGDTYTVWDKNKGKHQQSNFPSWAKVTGLVFIILPISMVVIGAVHGGYVIAQRRKDIAMAKSDISEMQRSKSDQKN